MSTLLQVRCCNVLVEWGNNAKITDQSPEAYLPALKARFGKEELARMYRWHAVPENWKRMDYRDFLEQRRERIAQVIIHPRVADDTGTAIRDRTRSIKKRVLEIAKVLKRRTGDSVQEVRRITGEMADIAEKTIVQHLRRDAQHIGSFVQTQQQRLTAQLENFLNLGEQVLRQARQVNAGQLHLPERVVSIFDPDARPIRRGKAHKENEFGYNVCLTESAERLVTAYSVMKGNPPDKELLVLGVEEHVRRTGRAPEGAATDRGFWHPENERLLQQLGVSKISLPYIR